VVHNNKKNVYSVKEDRIYLPVKITPKARKNAVASVQNGEVYIKIQAPPEGGKANKELIRFLSKNLRCAKTSIQIKTGETSRHKILILPLDCEEKLKGMIKILT